MSCIPFASIDVGPGTTVYIPKSWEDAREQFTSLAQEVVKLYPGSKLTSYPISRVARLSQFETLNLCIDVLAINIPDNRTVEKLLVHSSGVHGVEGFCGSAIQINFLHSITQKNHMKFPPGTGMLFIHCVNPYGMATLRRMNSNNVDLNRNFILTPNGHKQQPGASPEYRRLFDTFLGPDAISSHPGSLMDSAKFWSLAAVELASQGVASVAQTLAPGQYDLPQGIFYGGQHLQEEALVVLGAVKEFGIESPVLKELVHLDVHTGLGKWGRDTMMPGPKSQVSAGELFGFARQDLQDNTGFKNSGGLTDALEQLCGPDVVTRCVVQEFGTKAGAKVLNGMRCENTLWWRWLKENNVARPEDIVNGIAEAPIEISRRDPVKKGILDVFCLKEDWDWCKAIHARGRQAILDTMQHFSIRVVAYDDSEEMADADARLGPNGMLPSDVQHGGVVCHDNEDNDDLDQQVRNFA